MHPIDEKISHYVGKGLEGISWIISSTVKVALILTLVGGYVEYTNYNNKNQKKAIGQKTSGDKEEQLIGGINQVIKQTLDSMELEVKPSKEQIESDISKIRQSIIDRAGNDKELIEFIKTAEIIYSGFYNGELLYGLVRKRDGTISSIYNGNGDKKIAIAYTRDPYPGKNDVLGNGYRKLYNDILSQLGYKEEKGNDGIIRTYKIDKDGNKMGNEIDIRSQEYFDLHCNLQELRNIVKIKWIRETLKSGEKLNNIVLKEVLFSRVLTFDDIDFFKSNGNISDEQYNQAKEQIAKYYYRLVFLGVIKRAEAGTKTQEYFDKKYISEDTYKRTMKFLDEKK